MRIFPHNPVIFFESASRYSNQPFERFQLMHPNPGFQSLTEELGHQFARKDRLHRLEKAITNSIEMKEDGLSSMQEKYDMYKEGNIKFLRFNPDEETPQNKITFSRLLLN